MGLSSVGCKAEVMSPKFKFSKLGRYVFFLYLGVKAVLFNVYGVFYRIMFCHENGIIETKRRKRSRPHRWQKHHKNEDGVFAWLSCSEKCRFLLRHV